MLLRFIIFPVVKNFPKEFPYFFKDLASDFPHYKNMHYEISSRFWRLESAALVG